jgi:apolipoprotein N-acyltransferase
LPITADNGRQTVLRPAPLTSGTPPGAQVRPPLTTRCGLSLLSGLLLVACFPTLNWNLLVWIACVPLLIAVVTETRPIRAFLLGYLCGAVFLAGSCYWFVITMERYGGLTPALSVGVLILFVVLFSVIFGLFGLVESWMARQSPGTALALAPFLWVSLELLRTYYVTGFPWNLLGYAVQAAGLRQLASVTAVYGLSFLALSTSSLVASAALLWAEQDFSRDAAALRIWAAPVLWFALLALTNWSSRPPALAPASEDVYLLQPDAPLEDAAAENWAPWKNRKQLDNLLVLSSGAACEGFERASGRTDTGPDCAAARAQSKAPYALLVWAENPAPFLFSRDAVFHDAMEDLARRSHAYVIFNTVNYTQHDSNRPLNSAMVLDPAGQLIMQYDKMHLVPFGEYVPWWAFPGKVGKLVAEVGDFVPGTSYRTASTPEGAIAVPICYEDIFPQLVRRLTPKGPGVLVNITDDGWYGDSAARFQHLEMARFRAIENGRYLLRATNNGVTAVIDPEGRVVEQLPLHRAEVLRGQFSYLARQTFYTAHGDVFAWLCVMVTLGVGAMRVRAS